MKIQKKLLLGFLSIAAIILVAGILGIIEIRTIHVQSENIGMINAPLSDAVMEIKLTATTAHLWFEEILTGAEEKMVIAKVWKLIDESLWYCNAILHGGKNTEGHFYPVNDKQIEEKILSVQSDLKEFQQIAKLRFENNFGNKKLEDQVLDDKFDALFNQFIHNADEAETMIHAKMDKDAQQIDNTVTNSLWILSIATFLSFIVAVVLGIKISYTISKPIQEAVQLASSVAKGDFSRQVNKKYLENRNDEIRDLFQALSKMMTDIQTLITTTVAQKDEALYIKDKILRINQALDNVNTSVLIADNAYQIIYANQSVQQLFQEKQIAIRTDLPDFKASDLLIYSLSIFYKNPNLMHEQLAQLTTTYTTTLNLGGLNIDMKINPVNNAEGQHLGWVAEFHDRTAEITTEQEINAVMKAASLGDFSQRINIADKTYFFKTFSEGLNKTLDYNQKMIEELQSVFTTIARGDLSQTITKEYAGSLEQLKNAVNTTISKLILIMDGIQKGTEAASQGDFTQSIDLSHQEGFFATLSEQINQMLESIQLMIEELRQVFAAIASGDLTQMMTRDYVGILEQLKNDVNATVITLTQVIDTVQHSADIVAQATEEISQGNINLSQRTEEQAASLEETVANIEEMTGTVQQNSDHAQQANQLAASARDYAHKGGKIVETVIKAMSEISNSSKKVADIISVIDEIAFQTNLLALNAAVEAARAGEQGRGFAVVATEVRNLAQRSAIAAKEIKGLIKESVSKVEEGTRLVDQSGATLKKIVQATKKVSDIISEIAAASKEQTIGIQQINKVVAQLDDMTQQNSALVEEAAVSSETLKEQAQNLKKQVTFFKTSKEILSFSTTHSQNRMVTSPHKKNMNHSLHQIPRQIHEDDEVWKDF